MIVPMALPAAQPRALGVQGVCGALADDAYNRNVLKGEKWA